MAKGLIRTYARGHLHFITLSCYRRLPLLRTVAQVLKQRVSRRLRRRRRQSAGQLSLHVEGGDDSLPRFWQRRFYDFNVWSLKNKVEKLQ